MNNLNKKFIALCTCMLLTATSSAIADEVTCESHEGHRSECDIDNRGGQLRIVRTLSKTDCTEGKTWGYSRYGVWVDDGCRAVFSNGGSNKISASQDRCPAGFSPSEQKCTQQERRRGCKDMRLPSGLGCVHR